LQRDPRKWWGEDPSYKPYTLERVDQPGTVQVLHEHWTASTCSMVCKQPHTTERARTWTLDALAEFWMAVILWAVSAERLAEDAHGDLVYRLTRAWTTGSTGVPLRRRFRL